MNKMGVPSTYCVDGPANKENLSVPLLGSRHEVTLETKISRNGGGGRE